MIFLVRAVSLCSEQGNRVKMSFFLIWEHHNFFFFFVSFRKERSAGFLIHRIIFFLKRDFFFFLNRKLPHSLFWKARNVFFILLDMDVLCLECSVWGKGKRESSSHQQMLPSCVFAPRVS